MGALAVAACLVVAPALADEPAPGSLAASAEGMAKRGATAAKHGVTTAASATGRGVSVAASATARGVKKAASAVEFGAHKTGEAIQNVARKVGLPTTPSASTAGDATRKGP
jgi:hypothetical protein